MKTIYQIPLLALLLLFFAGCQDPVMPGFTEEANLHKLSVYGQLNVNKPKDYAAKIDDEKGLITIQVPYYISDVEQIKGDLTQMRVFASMPLGAKFEPKIEGLRDMTEGFTSTIHYADGTSKEYKFIAEYAKSSAAEIANIKMISDNNAAFVYRIAPEEVDGVTIISVAQFGYLHLQQLKAANLSIVPSPWATVSSNVTDGPVDVTDESLRFTVTAQDGTTVRTYGFKIVEPNYVPEGTPGSITPLFGVKVTKDDEYGWVDAQNRSMAVIGDELIIANLQGGLLRHNRFTGAPTGKTVDRTGIEGDIHGIAHDEAGHLVAATIASINNKYIPNHTLELFVWKDGIEGKPTKIYSLDLQNSPLMAGKNPNANTGRTMGIAGDVLGGKARIGFVFGGLNEFMVLSLNNGKVVKNSGLIAPKEVVMPLTNASKCIPTGVEDNDPVLIGMTADRCMVKSQMNGEAAKFGGGGHWWNVYGNTKGFAYARFNGMELVALGNGKVADWSAAVDWKNRLIVSNISDGTPGVLATGEILDSYNKRYDPNTNETSGDNEVDYGRLYGWLNERVGTNPNKVGDACFYVSPDGTTVQVYLMVTDMGFMGWEITKFEL